MLFIDMPLAQVPSSTVPWTNRKIGYNFQNPIISTRYREVCSADQVRFIFSIAE